MRAIKWFVLLACWPMISWSLELGEQIEYRKSVMKTLDEGVVAYRSALQLGASRAEIAKHLKVLALTSGQIKAAFEPRVDGGYAKADVWKKWADFSRRADTQSAKFAQLSELAASGVLSPINPDPTSALGCVACHNAYRLPVESRVASAPRSPAGADPVAYRQQIMRVIDAQTSAIGQILAGTVSEDGFASHLEVVSLMASVAFAAFERGPPGGASLPNVWNEKTNFLGAMQEFSDNALKASRIARQNGKDAAAVAVIDALPCRQCHDVYRRK